MSHPLPPPAPRRAPLHWELRPLHPATPCNPQPLGMPLARATLTRCVLFCCSSRIGAVPGLERILHLLLRKSRLCAAPLRAWLAGPGVGVGGVLCACFCLAPSLSVPRCPPDCLPLSVCLSLLLRCQAEEKMQSEVSPRPLLIACPCRCGAGERLAPLTPSALSPQQIRKLRRELESSQEKVATLTSQLSANVSPRRSCCRTCCSVSLQRLGLVLACWP